MSSHESSRPLGEVLRGPWTVQIPPPQSNRVIIFGGLALALCFYPVAADEFGINYTFLIWPFCLALIKGVKKPPDALMFAMLVFTGILLGSILIGPEVLGASIRRVVSYTLFMAIFSFSFVRVSRTMVETFKQGLVWVSLILSLHSVFELVRAGTANIGFEAKDEVGSQRVGFLMLMAIPVLYFRLAPTRGAKAIKVVSLAIIVTGLLLTFSRASVVGLIVIAVLLAFPRFIMWLRRPSFDGLWRGAAFAGGVTVLLAAVYWVFPIVFDFFDARLFAFMFDRDALTANVLNPETSEGTRVFLVENILGFIRDHPLTGSGYLGIWILRAAESGSAHNQYTDVVFRTGILGFVVYAGILVYIGLVLYKAYRDLFLGYIAVLVYGLFHETFKETQGAFLLAFLIGLAAEYSRRRSQPNTSRPRGASTNAKLNRNTQIRSIPRHL